MTDDTQGLLGSIRARQDKRRRNQALRAVRISDTEAATLASLGVGVAVRAGHASPSGGATQEQIDQWEREDRERRDQAMQEFRDAILERGIEAYDKGIDAATDRDARRAYNTRSIVLLLVVLAIVSMPIIGILAHLNPQSFGTFIAPVTGIAGTVVGYWFGTVDRQPSRREDSTAT
jgi:hypothetical protein